MDYKYMTSPCGMDCFNCAMYLAKDNEKLRGMMARTMNIPVEGAFCKGCRDEKGTVKWEGMTEPCSVWRCTQKKGISYCSECSDFPCDNLHPYADKAAEIPHNAKVFNLALIRKMGLEEWAKVKAKEVRNTYFKGKWKV
jgi:hypothetical protein